MFKEVHIRSNTFVYIGAFFMLKYWQVKGNKARLKKRIIENGKYTK